MDSFINKNNLKKAVLTDKLQISELTASLFAIFTEEANI